MRLDLRSKRLLRVLTVPVREVLLRGLPRGAFDRDFLLVRFPAGSVGAEIGVHEGDFSRRILRLTRPRRLHLIDPWKYADSAACSASLYGGRQGGDQARMDARHEAVRGRFRKEIAAGQVEIHRQRSAEACGVFPDEYFDWIYVDGDHRYEQVLRDLELYFPKVKPGGWITGDDYGEGGWWGDDVTRAVDAFVARGAGALELVRNRQYILQRRC